jgi:hypothetical protein
VAKLYLEREVQLLSGSGQYYFVEVFDAIANSSSMRDEVASLRTRDVVLEEKIENVLKSMQQWREIWNADREEETQARIHGHELKCKVAELEEKLALWKDVVRGIDYLKKGRKKV